MYEFIVENWEVIVSLGTTLAVYVGIAIPKVVGDGRTRRLLKGVNDGIELSQSATGSLTRFLGEVESTLERLELARGTLESGGEVLKEQLTKSTQEIELLRKEVKDLKEIINIKYKREL